MNIDIASNAQKGCIKALIAKLKLEGQKEDMIMGYTYGRTGSVGDLNKNEAIEIIRYLKSIDPDEQEAEIMRRKIISLAHEMNWRLPGTKKADMKHIDEWCVKFGYMHKKLNSYNYKELPALVTQFESVYRSFLKGV